jgi:hypothetical protein
MNSTFRSRWLASLAFASVVGPAVSAGMGVAAFGAAAGPVPAARAAPTPPQVVKADGKPEASGKPDAAAKPAEKATLAAHVKAKVAAALDAAEADGDYDAAVASLQATFDQVVMFGKDAATDELRQADFALRLASQLWFVPADRRKPLLQFMRGNDAFAKALVFLARPGSRQKPADVYAMVDALRAKRGEVMDKYPDLAAAICVVHAKPFTRRINENSPKAADPVDLFDYFVKNESRMFFGVKGVPADLLVYVVDTTADVDEMTWALGKYGGDKLVGKRFFDIKYDYEHFRKGTPKKVTVAGFTLPNILQFGGVCADQAYFAMAVGKSIGVPTAYTVGASGEVGHAWVGFLQADRGKGWWNFDVGRYTAYKGVRGSVIDPTNRESIPDSQVSLLAELIGTKPADRYAAAALTDAALRLAVLAKTDKQLAADPLPEAVAKAGAARPTPRKADTAESLSLAELALHQSSGHAAAWFLVRDLAKDNKLSLKDKKHWADLLQRLGGPKYPDFTLSVLAPMVETVSDYKEQNALWNAAFGMFQARSDLAASVRMSQAACWEKQDNAANAGQCYMDVIERFSNAGPFVIPALAKAEALLKDTGKADKVPVLYAGAWAKITPPQEMNEDATAQSNWYRMGKLYAKKLDEAGDSAKSGDVLEKLKNPAAAAAAAAGAAGGNKKPR